MPVTIQSVANAAGVSAATVSRVLRGDPRISAECVSRVHRAARTVNYVPLRNRNNSKPVHRLRGRNVGLLFLGLARSLEALPVVATAVHGAQDAVSQAGGVLTMIDIEDVTHMPLRLKQQKLDGLLIKGALQGPLISSMLPALREYLQEIPTVWLLGRPRGAWGDSVSSNDWEVGRIAAEALISNGHRRLAFVNPKPAHLTFCRREAGFRSVAEEAGATVTSFSKDRPGGWQLPLQAVLDVDCVQGLVDKVLEAEPKITAIFTPGDSIAALVYRAMAARGVVPGNQISVISANNEPAFRNALFPELATVDVRADLIGRAAVEHLIWKLGSTATPVASMENTIDPVLVDGKSIATV